MTTPSTVKPFRITRLEPGRYEGGGWLIERSSLRPLHGGRETVWNCYPAERPRPDRGLTRMNGFHQAESLAEAKQYITTTPVPPEGENPNPWGAFHRPPPTLDGLIEALTAARDAGAGATGRVDVVYGLDYFGFVQSVQVQDGAVTLVVTT